MHAVSILTDPPALLLGGEAYARALPESAQGGLANAAGAAVLATFWAGAALFWLDHPLTIPVRRGLGYRSGREFMLRFPLPDRGARRRRLRRAPARRCGDALAVGVFASYPLWWWLGWDHGRRARPRA